MKYMQLILQWGFFLLMSVYTFVVLIPKALGQVFLPNHDGFILVLAIIVGILWLVWPVDESVSEDHSRYASDISISGLLILQGVLFIHMLDIRPGILYLISVCVGGLLVGGGIMATGDDYPESVRRYLNTLHIPRLPGAFIVIALLLAVTGIPLMVFWLGIAQVAITSVTVWILMLGFGMLLPLGYKMILRSGVSNHPESLIDFIPNQLKYRTISLSIFIVCGSIAILIVGAVLHSVLGSTKVLEHQNQEELEVLSLIDSGSWKVQQDGQVVQIESAFFPDSELIYQFSPRESGSYLIVTDGYLHNLGGQVRLMVESQEEIILDESHQPLQCSRWMRELGLEQYLAQDRCPPLPVEMESESIELKAGQQYILTILPGDDFATDFEENLGVIYGGYIRIKKPELVKVPYSVEE